MSLAFLLAAADPGNWLEIVFIIVFLFGGAVKSILNARRERAKGPLSQPASAEREMRETHEAEDPRDGLERWREILEGRIEPPPPPPTPHPRRAPAPPPSLPDEVEHGYRSLVESEASVSPFAAAPSEEELEARRDEGAQVEVLATLAVAELALGHGEVSPALRRARKRSWRNALVGAEVLARPLALRRDDELPGSLPR